MTEPRRWSVYMKVSSAASIGDIKGPVRDRDPLKNGSIALLGVEHVVASPRDAATGLSTGKRRHFPMTILKEPDETSPLFYQLIATNGQISSVDLIYFGSDNRFGLTSDREIQLYTITLTSVFVSEIALSSQSGDEPDDRGRIGVKERISFVYDAIHWKWNDPRVEASDTFNSRNS